MEIPGPSNKLAEPAPHSELVLGNSGAEKAISSAVYTLSLAMLVAAGCEDPLSFGSCARLHYYWLF